jgi:hypothetical protein
MKDKIFIALIFISIIYVVIVLYVRHGKIKLVLVKNKVEPTTGKKDIIIDDEDVISYPKRFVVNLIYNDKETANLDLFADMSIRYEELINGTYKVPDHIKNGTTKDIIETNPKTNPAPEKKQEPVLMKKDVGFDELIDISKLNKNV